MRISPLLRSASSQHTVRSGLLLWPSLGTLLCLVMALTSCAKQPAPAEWNDATKHRANVFEALLDAERAPLPAGALRVRMAFGGAADLDLYVTDPLQESVYFANTPSRSGGVLAQDHRCASPAPRMESVTFVEPPPGRFRVGVDYAEGCSDAPLPASFVVEVEFRGRVERRRELIEPLHFRSQIWEFDLIR